MDKQKSLDHQRTRRRRRVRRQLGGNADRPRLHVFRSIKHIYCQVIDDAAGRTLAAASTAEAALRGQLPQTGNRAAAEAVGRAIAQRAREAGVEQVKLDRGHCKYHGRVAALANAAREAGLKF